MFSFKGFFTNDKNTHLEHLEDDIINRGSKGGVNAINFLKSVRDMLAGHSGTKINTTVKWDGAPAIICGVNPENGKFFVGTKTEPFWCRCSKTISMSFSFIYFKH